MSQSETPFNPEGMIEIKDNAGDVIAYYNDDFAVLNLDGQEIGYVDDNNQICDLSEAVITTMTQDNVVEDEAGADAIFGANAAAQETASELAVVEPAEVAELAEYEDDEEYEEYEEDDFGIEDLDEYLDVLNKRGMLMMDVNPYPANAPIFEEGDTIPEGFEGSQEETDGIYRELLDGLISQIEFNEDGTIENSSISKFGEGRSRELQAITSTLRADTSSIKSIEESLAEMETAKNAFVGGKESFLERAQAALGKGVESGLGAVKKNPKEAAAVGAAGLGTAIIGLPALAVGGVGYGVSKIMGRKKDRDQDPLILEIKALQEELEPMGDKIDKAYSKILEANETIAKLKAQKEQSLRARLISHRRLCVYIAAGKQALESLQVNTIAPLTAEYDQMQSEDESSLTIEAHLRSLKLSEKLLARKVEAMSKVYSSSKDAVLQFGQMEEVLSTAEIDIMTHISDTQPELEAKLVDARAWFQASQISEAIANYAKTGNHMLESAADIADATDRALAENEKNGALSNKTLEKTRAIGRKMAMRRLETNSVGDSQKRSRMLLEAADKVGDDVTKASRRKLLGPSVAKPSEEKKKGRRRVSKAMNNAANDAPATPSAPAAPAAPTGGRRRRQAPK